MDESSKLQFAGFPSLALTLSPSDVNQIQVDITKTTNHDRIWKAIIPYLILPLHEQSRHRVMYMKIISILNENPIFIEQIIAQDKDRGLQEQLFSDVALAGLLDIPRNPHFASLQHFLEQKTRTIRASSNYWQYCELALNVQEQLNIDFGAAAYYIDRISSTSEERENEHHSTSIEQKGVLYQEVFLHEQREYIDAFLEEEGRRELQIRRWKDQLAPTLCSWLERNTSVRNAEYILWRSDNDKLLLTKRYQEIFFEWRGQEKVFELWMEEQELLLLPIMEPWQQIEYQYWELPVNPSFILKFQWKNQEHSVDLKTISV